MSSLQVAGFLEHSTVNGEGFRSVLFLSGCPTACPGCHNLAMQAFDYGEKISTTEVISRIEKNLPLIDGVTFSGGEPFIQAQALLPLAQWIKSKNLTLWCYSGFVYENLIKDNVYNDLLKWIDVLIDGPFVQELADSNLLYRGSSNQRILKLNRGQILS